MQKNKLHFIGYSGHTYVCVEAALANKFDVLGYFELEEKLHNPYELDFLGHEKNVFNEMLFIGIGENRLRETIYNNLPSTCNLEVKLFHPNAWVSKTAKIEHQVLIQNGAQVNAQATIKKGVIINTNAVVEHECEIGQFSHIAPGAVLLGNVKIGSKVFVGAGSIIKQGLSICDNVTIGMGAVVTKNITEPGTYTGVPARKIK
jgi:sugar O-acyltransferase (sialic acid O-acetyltransferase NeuD family)